MLSANNHSDALGIVHKLYYKLTALNCPNTSENTNQNKPFPNFRPMNATHRSLLKLVKKPLVENMLLNKSVSNVRSVSVSVYYLFTIRGVCITIFASPSLPVLSWRRYRWRYHLTGRALHGTWLPTVHGTRLADTAPAVPIHGPGRQLSPCFRLGWMWR